PPLRRTQCARVHAHRDLPDRARLKNGLRARCGASCSDRRGRSPPLRDTLSRAARRSRARPSPARATARGLPLALSRAPRRWPPPNESRAIDSGPPWRARGRAFILGPVRLLCISDIHGHADALAAVLATAERRGFARILVAGDLCFPGPKPLETWRRLTQA